MQWSATFFIIACDDYRLGEVKLDFQTHNRKAIPLVLVGAAGSWADCPGESIVTFFQPAWVNRELK